MRHLDNKELEYKKIGTCFFYLLKEKIPGDSFLATEVIEIKYLVFFVLSNVLSKLEKTRHFKELYQRLLDFTNIKRIATCTKLLKKYKLGMKGLLDLLLL